MVVNTEYQNKHGGLLAAINPDWCKYLLVVPRPHDVPFCVISGKCFQWLYDVTFCCWQPLDVELHYMQGRTYGLKAQVSAFGGVLTGFVTGIYKDSVRRWNLWFPSAGVFTEVLAGKATGMQITIGLSRIHSADEDAVSWLTSYGSWHPYEKKKKIVFSLPRWFVHQRANNVGSDHRS